MLDNKRRDAKKLSMKWRTKCELQVAIFVHFVSQRVIPKSILNDSSFIDGFGNEKKNIKQKLRTPGITNRHYRSHIWKYTELEQSL